MNKASFLLLLAVSFLVSCNDDFLDRYPLSKLSPENSFNTAKDLELYTNDFYNDLPGVEGIIERDNLSDNILSSAFPSEQTGGRKVPPNYGDGGWSWGDLRKINLFFAHYERCTDVAAKKTYSGVAYFFRAWFYYNKLKRFGDVPWYDQVIGSGDKGLLMKPRDSRVYVVDKMIEDLDKAIANLGTQKSSDRINKWTALALKSRVCLFEGTFRKYHTNLNLPKADDLLKLAADAAEQVIKQGPYTLYSSGNPEVDYRDLFAADDAKEDEIMLTRRYNPTLNVMNNINYYFTSPTQSDVSLTKSLVNQYLLKTGARFTAQASYDTLQFYQETKNRDPRLAQTIRTPGYKRIGGSTAFLPDFSSATSGYQIIKFVADPSQDGFKAGHQDIPIIRYGEVLLNYAEAKAELGTLTQDDVNNSINKLRKRAGMPDLSLATANSDPDEVLKKEYPNVTGANLGVILEIRRERRIELVLEGFRYDDLMRWKNGGLLAVRFVGMYFPKLGAFDLDNDGTLDVEIDTLDTKTTIPQKVKLSATFSLSNGTSGNLMLVGDASSPNGGKKFNEARDYLYPIPSGDILLNPNLTQNPNW